MDKVQRYTWIAVTIFLGVACLYFLLGTTANFNRGIDLLTTVYYIAFWIPAVICILVSIVALFRQPPLSDKASGTISVLTFVLAVFIIPILFLHVNTEGWLTERIKSDSTRATSDGLYEYHLEIVNPFQRNVSTRLYLLNKKTEEESRLELDLSNYELNYASSYFNWIVLEPTDQSSIYVLTTIKPFLDDPQQHFKVDVVERTVKQIE